MPPEPTKLKPKLCLGTDPSFATQSGVERKSSAHGQTDANDLIGHLTEIRKKRIVMRVT
jgi:hypothetical protein